MSKLEVCSLQEFVEYDLVEQMKEWEDFKNSNKAVTLYSGGLELLGHVGHSRKLKYNYCGWQPPRTRQDGSNGTIRG